MNSQSTILVIGPSETGKTNFICRFWLALNNHESGSLVRDKLPSQLDYLNAGAKALLEGNFVERTPRGVLHNIEIPFKVNRSQETGQLFLPDISGEDCEQICSERVWSQEWEAAIKNFSGCLLFLRESTLVAPLNWLEAQRFVIAHRLGEPNLISTSTENEHNDRLPTQTLLVEWLQFIRHAINEVHGFEYRPRIGIVVAAWDEMSSDEQSNAPIEFLKTRTPLLHQYIEANDQNLFDFEVFGLSSTGGDLESDPAFKHRYLEADPHSQGYVVYSLNQVIFPSPDITLPVAWVLGEEPISLSNQSVRRS